MNILELIDRQARVRPDAVALRRGATTIRFGQLPKAINNLATHLHAQGIAPGDRVGIAMGHAPAHVVVILALARLGAISFPVHALHPAATRKTIVEHFKPATLVAARREDGIEGCGLVLADPSWIRRPAAENLPPLTNGNGNHRDAYFWLSSGSTGVPKGVLRTHDDLFTQVLLLTSVFPAAPGTRFLCAMDVNVGASLMRLLRYLTTGSAVVFPDEHQWEAVQEVLADNEPTHTFVSPSHLSRWLRELGERRASAAALKYMAVGGGRLSPALRRRAVEHLTSGIHATYGASETGLTALQYPDDPEHDLESVGRIVPWVEAQAVDDEDRPLPAGKQGRLRFRGHGFGTEYYDNPDATARSFRNGWFYPGDVGWLNARGSLFIASREDDVLNVRGLKVDPAESEAVLTAHPAVAEAATFRATTASGDEFLVSAVVKCAEIDDKALLAHCRERLGPRAPRRIVAVRELPRDAMGKVIRSEIVKRIRAHAAD